MKTVTVLISFLLMMVVVTGCQESFDPEKEKEAIIKVINDETDAYADYNFEALAETHLQDSTNMRLTAGRDTYVFLEGWDAVGKYLQEDIEGATAPEDQHVSVEKSNYRIKVYPECAWVVCDEKWTYRYTTDTVEIKSIQVRLSLIHI